MTPHADDSDAGGPPCPSDHPTACVDAFPKSQSDFEIAFFGRVLLRSPNFVDVLRRQGELLTSKGRHAEALKVDQRLVALLPDDGVVHYNLACSLAQGGSETDAIRALNDAFERGYDDFEYLAADSDLDPLRDLPGYQKLLRDYGIADC